MSYLHERRICSEKTKSVLYFIKPNDTKNPAHVDLNIVLEFATLLSISLDVRQVRVDALSEKITTPFHTVV